MSILLDGALVVNFAGGLALFALGVWLATLPVRTPARSALVAYALALGLAMVASNVLSPDTAAINLASFALTTFFALAASGAVLWLVHAHLREWRPGVMATGAIAAGAAGLFAIWTTATFALGPPARAALWGLPPGAPAAEGLLSVAGTLAFFTFIAVAWLGLGLLAWSAVVHRAMPPEETRRVALLSAGLAIFPATNAGTIWPVPPEIQAFAPRALLDLFLASHILPPLALSALWLVVAFRPGARRAARDLALLLPAAVFAGMLLAWLGGPRALGAWGLARVVGALVLAYAVLRHQLLGIDVRVRWAISRSTLAAAFIAVFFLASEGAQLLFGQENEVVGLLAAGALVFALAPLQRAADRLAERAVPLATPTPGASSSGADREEAYRRALRLALRDRAVTREEDVHLHEVAEHMGIGAGRAMALRVEVERELSQRPFPEGDG